MKFLLENSNIILYHNTPYENVESILNNGLLISKSLSEVDSGYRMIWASTVPLGADIYGGNTIKFELPQKR